jgi:hypothetical protein
VRGQLLRPPWAGDQVISEGADQQATLRIGNECKGTDQPNVVEIPNHNIFTPGDFFPV